ncbi:MCE family protein [Amycolatopsis sp. NPDC049691]|uniref:MCE family protein n=1 Tax=Amycolatopsis sp. NPDC049691 TaxID=3155155 RepID=UPI0034174D0E
MAILRWGHGRLTRVIAVVCVVALVVAGALWWLLRDDGATKLTAYFTQAIGVYPGSKVTVLGVDVGKVDQVTPGHGNVEVVLSVDRSVAVPAGVRAVIVTPTLVSDRYVELTPVFTGGPQAVSGTVIPQQRTNVPVELDELYSSLEQVSKALGPDGANKNGDLSNLINTGAKVLDGNGEKLHQTMGDLAKLAETLTSHQDDLFGTVDNLNKFTKTLHDSDDQIRSFASRLNDVSGYLAGQGDNLDAALAQLSASLSELTKFVRDNRDRIKGNVGSLQQVTQTLVDQRGSLAEILDVAPIGVSNYVDLYDQSTGGLTARLSLNELANPPVLAVCKLLKNTFSTLMSDTIAKTCGQAQPVLDGAVKLPTPAQILAGLQDGSVPALFPMAGLPSKPGGN